MTKLMMLKMSKVMKMWLKVLRASIQINPLQIKQSCISSSKSLTLLDYSGSPCYEKSMTELLPKKSSHSVISNEEVNLYKIIFLCIMLIRKEWMAMEILFWYSLSQTQVCAREFELYLPTPSFPSQYFKNISMALELELIFLESILQSAQSIIVCKRFDFCLFDTFYSFFHKRMWNSNPILELVACRHNI